MHDCDLTFADFTGANFSETELTDNRLNHCIFDKTNLAHCIITDCELNSIEAEGLTLQGADLLGSTMGLSNNARFTELS